MRDRGWPERRADRGLQDEGPGMAGETGGQGIAGCGTGKFRRTGGRGIAGCRTGVGSRLASPPADGAVGSRRLSTKLDFRGDPADELIAATSVVHNVPLVTRDRSIRRSKVVPLALK